MKKLLLALAIFASVGCSVQPITSTFDCKTDCKTELTNMAAYTSKFSYYTMTKSTKDGFSASMSSQDNFNFRSGSVSNGYMNVWIEGRKINVEAVNNAMNDTDMVLALEKAKDYNWPAEKVHKMQSVLVDDRGMVDQLFLNNRSY